MKIHATNNKNVIRTRTVTINLKETNGTKTSTKSLGKYEVPPGYYIKAIMIKGIYKFTIMEHGVTQMRVGTVMQFITDKTSSETL